MTIGPALPLALLVGLLNTAIYVLLRGDAGGRLPLTYVAAVLGAWAGAAVGGRLGIDVLTIGDFALIPAIDPGLGRHRDRRGPRDARPAVAEGALMAPPDRSAGRSARRP